MSRSYQPPPRPSRRRIDAELAFFQPAKPDHPKTITTNADQGPDNDNRNATSPLASQRREATDPGTVDR
ncbi:hypothetical protein [uncultured Thiohalocapsa sp.]|uniref:hypothetical protein n=1 Tax=uncultured Thiohalocapsa sp. TaxID=768990 RepID=UPI0025E40A28|nr:hypothetical protein [uncultured Thiohalocapsa sp.]